MMSNNQERLNVLNQNRQQIGKLSLKVQQPKRVCPQPLVDLAEESRIIPLKICEFDLEMNKIEIESVLDSFVPSKFGTIPPGFAAYKLARSQNPDYVNNLKIRFLRAKKYDARKVARLLLRNLKDKLELFGSDNLTRDIFSEDVGEDGLRYLELGGLKVSDDSLKRKFSDLSIQKSHFYSPSDMDEFLATVNFDEDVEPVDEWESNNLSDIGQNHGADSADGDGHGNLNFGDVGLVDGLEASYGADRADDGGHGNGSNIEGHNIRTIITCPSDLVYRQGDVLLGRGIKHPGNEKFRRMVNNKFEKYEALTTTKKRENQNNRGNCTKNCLRWL